MILPLKGTLFFNPSSGASLPPGEVDQLKSAARAAGLDVADIGSGLDIAGTIRQRMHRGQTIFVAAGGDGTINHVLQPLVHTDAHLAVIPFGTFNHFAKDLGIPLDWRAALEVALNGSSERIDTALVNERFFVNNLAIGLYPELVARREARGRDYPRWMANLQAAFTTLRKYRLVTVTVESDHHQEVIRTNVFMVSNNSYDLSRIGIEAPRHSLTSEQLSVYWLPHLSRLALIRFGGHYLAGQATAAAEFRSFKTKRMRVRSSHPRITIGVDGELFKCDIPLVITIVPSSLLVKVPARSE
jgi:diacylglycerol kinase family enzyme